MGHRRPHPTAPGATGPRPGTTHTAAVRHWKSPLRYGPLEARRTAFSVAVTIFWRMRGEIQQAGSVASGHDRYESGLRTDPAVEDHKRGCRYGLEKC
jgi:hypothetical protein